MAKRKPTYPVRNWGEYNKSLVQRGSLTVWVSWEVLALWRAQPSGKRGHPQTYSDLALESMAMLRAVYHLSQRATQGLLASVLHLMGVALPVPSYSTLSRRQQRLTIRLPHRPPGAGVHLVVDSTGVKVFGEGEWKVRQHGKARQRTWKKLHVGVDETTGEVLAAVVTDNSMADHEVVPALLAQVAVPLTQFSADGAYDKRLVYATLAPRPVKVAIPPRRGARIWQHGNTKQERLSRDENLRAIRQQGRKAWKQRAGYHRRSLAETFISRFKRILGPTISAQTFASQTTEIIVRCKILNVMSQLGRPISFIVS